MKKVRINALLLVSLLGFVLAIVLASCSQSGNGPDRKSTPMFSSDVRVILTPEEESEIIAVYAEYANEPDASPEQYNVRCLGLSSRGAYAVIIEREGYVPTSYDDYRESPTDTPVTREAFGLDKAYDFWYDSTAPFMIYFQGMLFSLRDAHRDGVVTPDYIAELYERYRSYNKEFYDSMTEEVVTEEKADSPEDLSAYGRVLVVISGEKSRELHNYLAADFSEIGCVYVRDLSTSAAKWVQVAKDIKAGKDSLDNYPRSKHSYINRILDDYNQILCLYVEETTEEGILKICDLLKTRSDILSAEPDRVISID